MNYSIFILFSLLFTSQIFFIEAYAQATDSPFERNFGDIKYLDSYFGTEEEKMEVDPGDKNVPFTVVLANIGTQDITGIKGQLAMPFGFSASDGTGALILADSDSNSDAGDNFALTFFVNIGQEIDIRQHSASIKVDYSRLRESGTRNGFFAFDFKVTGDSIINMHPVDPFLTSLQQNHVIIEVANDGTAPISGVDIELSGSATKAVTNMENVVVLNSNWDIGHIDPGSSEFMEFEVYVPDSLLGETLRAPMLISYFNAHGDRQEITRIVDFFVKGLIDPTIYDIRIIELSEKQTIVGDIINEGNEDALFAFVTLSPLGNSNIKEITQFIDEVEVESPVPFNVPIEFDGEPRYGQHDVEITLRYKDSLREENFYTHETSIFLENPSENGESEIPDVTSIIVPLVVLAIAIVGFKKYRSRKKAKLESQTS